MSWLSNIQFLLRHPLNRQTPLKALWRVFRWQLSASRSGKRHIMNFAGPLRFYARKGWTGVSGNIYCGLHDYAEMSFVVHCLRPGDLFADIGAHMGTYSLLASGIAGARSLAVEPLPATFACLEDNLVLNELTALVDPVCCGLAAAPGKLNFSTGKGTMNAVTNDSTAAAVVPVTTLDILLAAEQAFDWLLLKIDVEGYETAVLQGAAHCLADARLKAIIMETNGSGNRYGYDEAALHAQLLSSGFSPCSYDPRRRHLLPLLSAASGNTIYVRDLSGVAERLKTAPAFTVLGQQL